MVRICVLSLFLALAASGQQVTRNLYCAATSANPTAYACTIPNTPSGFAYQAATVYRMKIDVGNGSIPTANFNSLGALQIVKSTAGGTFTTVSAGDLCAGQIVDLTYDGVGAFQLSSPVCTSATGSANEIDLYSQNFIWSDSATINAGSNTVSLAPCPLGVNGTDVGHQYYLLGGTPEVVTGTGGTCTSGASSGTLTFTSSGSHTAITTATAGVQEAVIYCGTFGVCQRIVLPGTTLNFQGTVTINYAGITIEGTGGGGGFGAVSTKIQPTRNNQILFSQPITGSGNNLHFSGVNFSANSFTNATAFSIVGQVTGLYQDNSFDGVHSYFCDRCSMMSFINNTSWNASVAYFGSTVDGGSGYADHITVDRWFYRGTPGNVTLASGNSFSAANMPVIEFERIVAGTVAHLKTFGMSNLGIGILMGNDCQGTELSNNFILQPNNGVEIIQTTVGATSATPSWTIIDNLQVDQFSGIAVWVVNPSYHVAINNSILTNPVGSAVSINLPANQMFADIMGGKIGGGTANAIVISGSSQYVKVVNTSTFAASPQSAIIVNSGSPNTQSDIVISGNNLYGTGNAIAVVGGVAISQSAFYLNNCQTDAGGPGATAVCNHGIYP